MDTDHQIRTRRALMRLGEKANGDSVLITCTSTAAQQVIAEALKFARKRKLGIAIDTTDQGVRVTRDDNRLAAPASRFAALSSLDVGQAHTFDMPPEEHHKIRNAASLRSRAKAGPRFKCERVGDAIRVTRMPDGSLPVTGRQRAHKYDLSALHEKNAIRFKGIEVFVAVRSAAAQVGRSEGWDLYTRVTGHTITVYRLDNLTVAEGVNEARSPGAVLLGQIASAAV